LNRDFINQTPVLVILGGNMSIKNEILHHQRKSNEGQLHHHELIGITGYRYESY
jgi:hypothetical protein